MVLLMPRLSKAPAYPKLIESISAQLFGEQVHCEWIASDEADIFRLETSTTGSARIVKIERAGGWVVQREQAALRALRPMGLPELPEIELTQQELKVEDTFFSVMPATPWRPFNEIWNSGVSHAIWVMHRAGDFLRRLRSIDWRNVPGALSPTQKAYEYFSYFEPVFRPLKNHRLLPPDLAEALDSILSMFRAEPSGFGGWQGGQILTDGTRSFTAIDWPHVGAHWPLNDLSGLTATLGFYSVDAPKILLPELLNAYFDGAPSAEEEAELTLWRVSNPLGRAARAAAADDSPAVESALALAHELLASSS